MYRIILEPVSSSAQAYAQGMPSVVIERFPFVLGRHGSCDYQFDEPQISRWHCRFVDAGSEIQVTDLDSRNGTFLNNLPLHSPQPIQTGDILMLGRWQFRIDMQCRYSPQDRVPLTKSEVETRTAGQ